MLNTASATCISNVVVVHDRRIVNDRFVHIGVVNHGSVHIDYGCVIREVSTAPFTAGKTDAHVTEAVVHAAVVADMETPVAVMEEIMPAFPAPVRRRPKVARLRSRHPGARHPVIAELAISPISRRPQIAVIRARWLHIDWHYRRGDADADKHSGKRRCRDEAKQSREQKHAR
jgi:hypothetical protein